MLESYRTVGVEEIGYGQGGCPGRPGQLALGPVQRNILACTGARDHRKRFGGKVEHLAVRIGPLIHAVHAVDGHGDVPGGDGDHRREPQDGDRAGAGGEGGPLESGHVFLPCLGSNQNIGEGHVAQSQPDGGFIGSVIAVDVAVLVAVYKVGADPHEGVKTGAGHGHKIRFYLCAVGHPDRGAVLLESQGTADVEEIEYGQGEIARYTGQKPLGPVHDQGGGQAGAGDDLKRSGLEVHHPGVRIGPGRYAVDPVDGHRQVPHRDGCPGNTGDVDGAGGGFQAYPAQPLHLVRLLRLGREQSQAELHIPQRQPDGVLVRGVVVIDVPVAVAVHPVGAVEPHEGVKTGAAHGEHVRVNVGAVGQHYPLAGLFESQVAAEIEEIEYRQVYVTGGDKQDAVVTLEVQVEAARPGAHRQRFRPVIHHQAAGVAGVDRDREIFSGELDVDGFHPHLVHRFAGGLHADPGPFRIVFLVESQPEIKPGHGKPDGALVVRRTTYTGEADQVVAADFPQGRVRRIRGVPVGEGDGLLTILQEEPAGHVKELRHHQHGVYLEGAVPEVITVEEGPQLVVIKLGVCVYLHQVRRCPRRGHHHQAVLVLDHVHVEAAVPEAELTGAEGEVPLDRTEPEDLELVPFHWFEAIDEGDVQGAVQNSLTGDDHQVVVAIGGAAGNIAADLEDQGLVRSKSLVAVYSQKTRSIAQADIARGDNAVGCFHVDLGVSGGNGNSVGVPEAVGGVQRNFSGNRSHIRVQVDIGTVPGRLQHYGAGPVSGNTGIVVQGSTVLNGDGTGGGPKFDGAVVRGGQVAAA